MPPSRTPPLLQPYTSLPAESSLHLLTSVLGASTNWLVVRFLCGALAENNAGSSWRSAGGAEDGGTGGLSNHGSGTTGQDEEGEVAVVLVSWMRDWEFWKSESRRAGGLDLARLAQQDRFAFVDGLVSLFMPPAADQISQQAPTSTPTAPVSSTQLSRPSPLPVRSGRSIPPRSPAVSSRHPAPAAPSDQAQHVSPLAAHPANLPAQPKGLYRLTSPALEHLEQVLSRAIAGVAQLPPGKASPRKILLILDAPDLHLAAADPSSGITASSMAISLLKSRQRVHATVLAVAADSPLVSAATSASASASTTSSLSSTPLETAHASFLISQAHLADVVMSLRLLDTGFAADVSGVLRITLGDAQDDGEEGQGLVEKEVLYSVGGDGGVKVFERGAGGGNE
ncbi:hypothetical protein W97_06848 [Coniosporium apollinis CBS 100218]|uniref:Elongator complex protein 5 n=1 Tax=Coniosporium apollinis (strain CBS 100218) TaxID=1168221 RepID=R7Z0I2_CONA1|nr:uncharacterized protein W97_06848 [Coniosporium apollinis CBS 100218]EON67705.1 hypothetical protein W97_06848 [Coniosporium apollinis CBS 100218]